MIKNRFQGDLKLLLTENGTTLNFISGQPEMDDGLENQALLSLFIAPGWWGNSLIDDVNQKLGSDFEETARGAITLRKLRDIEQSAEKNLKAPVFGEKTANAINLVGWKVDLSIEIKSPGKDVEELRITRNGQNWLNQARG